MKSVLARGAWFAVLGLFVFIIWQAISQWNGVNDAWGFLVSARDSVAPFFEGIGEWVSSIDPTPKETP